MSTRERIVDEALTLFSTKGYAGTTVRDIADAVGIRDASLYKHFPSKRAIFDTCVDDMSDRMGQLGARLGILAGDKGSVLLRPTTGERKKFPPPYPRARGCGCEDGLCPGRPKGWTMRKCATAGSSGNSWPPGLRPLPAAPALLVAWTEDRRIRARGSWFSGLRCL